MVDRGNKGEGEWQQGRGMEVSRMSGRCGVERIGQRRWTPPTMVVVWQWPIFNYATTNLFLTPRQRKELAKECGKGKAVGGRREENTKVTMVSNCAKDSSGSFDNGHVSDSGTVGTQPMCVAKLPRQIVVDASHSSIPGPAGLDISLSPSCDATDSSLRNHRDASMSTAAPTTTGSM